MDIAAAILERKSLRIVLDDVSEPTFGRVPAGRA